MTTATVLTASQLDVLRLLIERHPGLRCLTVKQPWTDLIVAGVKDVENRSKPVPSTIDLPTRIGIHAAKTVDRTAAFRLAVAGVGNGKRTVQVAYRWFDYLSTRSAVRDEFHDNGERLGALLGTVEVTGCHHADECVVIEDDDPTGGYWSLCSRWAEDDVWHWTLTDPEPLPEPIPMCGMLGLWKLDLVTVAPA